jgi:hypothetical protein
VARHALRASDVAGQIGKAQSEGAGPWRSKFFSRPFSDEFRAYRDWLRKDLTRHNVEVKVQEDFKDLGRGTLDELDVYIASCDAVVHLVGHMIGAAPGARDVSALFVKYPNLMIDVPPLGNGDGVSYTQWEAWLALYHRKDLYVVQAAENAERGPKYAPTDASRATQTAHLKRLREAKRYPGFTFTSPLDLANHLKSTGILDLLVRAYAEVEARARHVAEGFIREMAKRVARPGARFRGHAAGGPQCDRHLRKRDRRGTNRNQSRRHCR